MYKVYNHASLKRLPSAFSTSLPLQSLANPDAEQGTWDQLDPETLQTLLSTDGGYGVQVGEAMCADFDATAARGVWWCC
jgi:hypothetical protein